MLEKPDFSARWIAPFGAENEKNFYFRARKRFLVEEPADGLFLRISAESYYQLFINGRRIGLGPARGTFSINYFDTYPVPSVVNAGWNEIVVLCLCMNIETFVAAPAGPGLIVEITNILKTDETWDVAPANEEWKREVMPYTQQTGYSEWRDLRKEVPGWETGRADLSWEKAVCLDPSSPVCRKRLLPRNVPLLRERIIPPVEVPVAVRVPELGDLDCIRIAERVTEEDHVALEVNRAIDFRVLAAAEDQELTLFPEKEGAGIALVVGFAIEIIGRFELDITAPSGTVVDIAHEEQMVENRLRVSHQRPNGERYDFADRYILRNGRQRIGNTLMERGFRYVQLVFRNFNEPLILHRVRAIDRRYPFDFRASFRCGDTELEKIWAACAETLSACTTDVFTDCPWRERAFWSNDLLVENLIALQLSGDRHLSRRALEMLFSEKTEDGFVKGVCPCPREGQSQAWLVLPTANLFLPLILRDFHLYLGDLDILAEFLPQVAQILESFERFENEDGLLILSEDYWNFFDWSFEENGHSLSGKTTAPLNFLYIIALKAYVDLCRISGDLETEVRLGPKIDSLAQACEKSFYNQSTGRLCDFLDEGRHSDLSSQLTHALALLSGELRSEIGDGLAAGIDDDSLLVPELFLHYFIFAAQKLSGNTDLGLARIRKYWGPVVASGCPTIWEFGVHSPGKEALNGLGSLCHAFATAPVDFFQTVILGITPVEPGFRKFSVAPQPSGLQFAEGFVPSPFGNICIAWKRKHKKLLLRLDVPEGTHALVRGGGELGAGHHEFVREIENGGNE